VPVTGACMLTHSHSHALSKDSQPFLFSLLVPVDSISPTHHYLSIRGPQSDSAKRCLSFPGPAPPAIRQMVSRNPRHAISARTHWSGVHFNGLYVQSHLHLPLSPFIQSNCCRLTGSVFRVSAILVMFRIGLTIVSLLRTYVSPLSFVSG
jgi:hypothetical protein